MAVVTGPCDWPIDDCSGCLAALEPAQAVAVTGWAVDWLDAATGRRFARCETTVRPCAPDACRCGPTDTTCLCEAPRVELFGGAASITSVTIGADTIPAASYRIDDGRWLTRIDGQRWPATQDMTDACGTGTAFCVTYQPGLPAPPGTGAVVAMLACELAKAVCNDASCQLPRRVQTVTRQGVTIAFSDAFQGLDQGKTGIFAIDGWIESQQLRAPTAEISSGSGSSATPGTGSGGGGGATDTDLGYVAAPGGGTVTSSTGSSAAVPLADPVNAGLLSPADFTKLAANTTDVTLAGSLDYLTIAGQIITRNAIDLTTDVTGTLPEGNGGSGGTVFETQVAATSAVAANTAKVTNATHTGDVAGSGALTLESVAITGQTSKATPVGADTLLISDSAASGALKKATAQSIVDLVEIPISFVLSEKGVAVDAADTDAGPAFRMPFAAELLEVRVALGSATTTGTVTVDLLESGVSVLSTLITVDATETTSTTAATPPVISDSALADDAAMRWDITGIGDGTAVDVTATMIVRPT